MSKRKRIEKIIYDTMSALDPTGVNREKYQAKFSKMNDAQFTSYINKMMKSDDYFVLDIVDYERDLQMQDIEKAAKIVDVELFEYVALPFVNMSTEQPVVTKFPVITGYLHTKRTQQTIMHKNTTSTEIAERSALTGQVTGGDKNARESDVENFAMVTLDANENLREFMGPRADDSQMKREMHSDIRMKGYTNLEGMTNSTENKTTLNTVDVMFISMGLNTDLVRKGLLVTKTLDNK